MRKNKNIFFLKMLSGNIIFYMVLKFLFYISESCLLFSVDQGKTCLRCPEQSQVSGYYYGLGVFLEDFVFLTRILFKSMFTNRKLFLLPNFQYVEKLEVEENKI